LPASYLLSIANKIVSNTDNETRFGDENNLSFSPTIVAEYIKIHAT
jgi:hypothetical protein